MAAGNAEFAGATYYFCSAGCRAKFIADPGKYLKLQGPKLNLPTSDTAIYTCPMHPQIRQSGPGFCPICGMALEPLDVTADAGPNPELRDMTRRFSVGLALGLPVAALGMLGEPLGINNVISPTVSVWLQFALTTPVVFWAGWPFLVRGWASLVARSLNMFTLIALGTGVAWLYSVFATVLPDVFPSTFRSAEGMVGVYYEAAAVITVLVLLGQVLELRAREHTSGANQRYNGQPGMTLVR